MGSKQYWKWMGLILFVLAFAWTLWSYFESQVNVVLAWDQIYVFHEYAQMEKASNNPKEVAQYLAGIVQYRQKRETENRLMRMVEMSREAYVRLCIEHLRKLTKKDLGDDPKIWIEAYGK